MKNDTTVRPGILPQLFCGLLLSFTLFLYGPLELFLANRDSFLFSGGTILPLFAAACIAVFAVVEGVLLLIRKLPEPLYDIALALLFAVAIGLYLQGTYLSSSNALIEGTEPHWGSLLSSVLVNIVIWLVLLLAALVTVLLKKNLFRKIVLFASILVFANECIVLGVTAIRAGSTRAESSSYVFSTDKDEFVFSQDGDVIVFMLDGFDVRIMDNILEDDPAALDFLNGFTYYHNNSSLYCNTEPSLTYMLTGSRYYNEIPKREWYEQSFAESTFFDTLSEGGYSTELYGMPSVILSEGMLESVDNLYAADSMRVTDRVKVFNAFLRLVLYKYAPSVIQPFVYSDFNSDFQSNVEPAVDDVTITVQDDPAMKGRLESNGVQVTNRAHGFKFYAMMGAHAPYIIDRYAQTVDSSATSQYEQSLGSLYILNELFSRLKEEGVYDKCTIILLGDHGSSWVGSIRGTPMMLVKYPGQSGTLTVSEAPVCQEDLRATILCGAGLDYTPYGTPAHLWEGAVSRERLYYTYDFSAGEYFGRMTEFKVPDDASYLVLYSATGKTY